MGEIYFTNIPKNPIKIEKFKYQLIIYYSKAYNLEKKNIKKYNSYSVVSEIMPCNLAAFL